MNMNMISLVAAMQVRNKEGGDQIANSMMISAFLPNEMSALAPLLMMQSVTGTIDEAEQAKASQIATQSQLTATQAKLEASNKVLKEVIDLAKANESIAAVKDFATKILKTAESIGVSATVGTSGSLVAQ